jgi:Flp pilus assembly protein TadG
MRVSTKRAGHRARGDEGAALVEFAFVAILLFGLVFGIIHYGLILNFKQDVTRAAAEGARAGAVAFPVTSALTDAQAATEDAVEAFGGGWSGTGCSRAGVTCDIQLEDCDGITDGCVRVTIAYDYDGDGDCGDHDPAVAGEPLFGEIPIVSGLTAPDCVQATSVARTNA